MENGVTDRLWDKDVQEFIEACKHGHLSDVLLDYTEMENRGKVLESFAHYRSLKHGQVPIGYRWTKTRALGWLPQAYVYERAAPANDAAAVRKLAWQAGLWRERGELGSALQAVTQVYFRAQLVRGGLDQEHLAQCGDASRAEGLTLRVLNDLAFLYSSR